MTGKMRAAKTIAKARITRIYESYRRKMKTKTVPESVNIIKTPTAETEDVPLSTRIEIDPMTSPSSVPLSKIIYQVSHEDIDDHPSTDGWVAKHLEFEVFPEKSGSGSVLEEVEASDGGESTSKASLHDMYGDMYAGFLEVQRKPAPEQSTIATPHAGAFFRGYCFAKLRHGRCLRQTCRFHHNLSTVLQNLCSMIEPQQLNELMIYATQCKFVYFSDYIYAAVFHNMF